MPEVREITHCVACKTEPVLSDMPAFITSLTSINATFRQWLNLHQMGTPGQWHNSEHFVLILLDNKIFSGATLNLIKIIFAQFQWLFWPSYSEIIKHYRKSNDVYCLQTSR